MSNKPYKIDDLSSATIYHEAHPLFVNLAMPNMDFFHITIAVSHKGEQGFELSEAMRLANSIRALPSLFELLRDAESALANEATGDGNQYCGDLVRAIRNKLDQITPSESK